MAILIIISFTLLALWLNGVFHKKNECPWCEGYGEIYDELDYEEPHKECKRCAGSGEWEFSDLPKELHAKHKHLGLM